MRIRTIDEFDLGFISAVAAVARMGRTDLKALLLEGGLKEEDLEPINSYDSVAIIKALNFKLGDKP